MAQETVLVQGSQIKNRLAGDSRDGGIDLASDWTRGIPKESRCLADTRMSELESAHDSDFRDKRFPEIGPFERMAHSRMRRYPRRAPNGHP